MGFVEKRNPTWITFPIKAAMKTIPNMGAIILKSMGKTGFSKNKTFSSELTTSGIRFRKYSIICSMFLNILLEIMNIRKKPNSSTRAEGSS